MITRATQMKKKNRKLAKRAWSTCQISAVST